MDDAQSLSHRVWDCKYHVVWIQRYPRKVVYGELRRHLGEVFGELASQRETRVLEGHIMSDYVPMLISILPKYAVSAVIGEMKQYTVSRLWEKFGWLEKMYRKEWVV